MKKRRKTVEKNVLTTKKITKSIILDNMKIATYTHTRQQVLKTVKQRTYIQNDFSVVTFCLLIHSVFMLKNKKKKRNQLQLCAVFIIVVSIRVFIYLFIFLLY